MQPLAIMTGLPLALVGAFGLLLAFGNTVNMFSLMGLILLVGIATKNGILLVDFTNQVRARGYRVAEALVEAGATRLRPILMTAVSTIAGVVPVVFGLGVGSESRQPLAVAITGGVISSTFLTLVVVPVAYSYLEQLGRLRVVGWIRERVLVRESGDGNQGGGPAAQAAGRGGTPLDSAGPTGRDSRHAVREDRAWRG